MRDIEEIVERGSRGRAGLVLGVLRRGETTVLGRSAESGVPGESTLFEIGSITKTFTSLLLADGALRGDWDLDAPVRTLLPPEARVPTRGGREITLEHLATHRAGLPSTPVPVLRGSVEMLRGRDPYAGLTTEGLLEALGAARLRGTPGAGRMRYSNLGVAILGLALARACGTSYGALVEERICRPLELADTATHDRLTGEQRSRLVPGHRRRGGPAPAWPLDGLSGAGALRSTSGDMLRYLRAQLAPDTTALAEAIRLTQQPRTSGRQRIGLGWLGADRPDRLWWHNGGTGGYRSFAAFVPDKQVAVVVLSNTARSVDLLALKTLKALTDRQRL